MWYSSVSPLPTFVVQIDLWNILRVLRKVLPDWDFSHISCFNLIASTFSGYQLLWFWFLLQPLEISSFWRNQTSFGGDSRGTRHDVWWKSTVSVLISEKMDSKTASEFGWAGQKPRSGSCVVLDREGCHHRRWARSVRIGFWQVGCQGEPLEEGLV